MTKSFSANLRSVSTCPIEFNKYDFKMKSLNNFVAAADAFVKRNPTQSTSSLSRHIASELESMKKNKRALLYSIYNVALLNAIALTDDYSIESVQSLVDTLPVSDSDSKVERIKGILVSGKGRNQAYVLRDIKNIVDGLSGSNQCGLDATFELLLYWSEQKHSELNSLWTGKVLEPLLGYWGFD